MKLDITGKGTIVMQASRRSEAKKPQVLRDEGGRKARRSPRGAAQSGAGNKKRG